MAKSVEQRTKELVDSTTRCFLVSAWAEIAADYKKDLDSPKFKGQGDMAGFAKRYDTAADNFIKADQRKQDAKKLFSAAELDKLRKSNEGLKNELEQVSKDEGASLRTTDNATKVEDILNNWEEALKAQQDLNKMRKIIYDKLMKSGEDYAKALNDGIGKVKKEIDAAKAGLGASNNELNALEGQIRATVVKYQKVALDMDRKEIADAVRGFLACFG
jgi:archaellum component FlaC